MADLAHGLITRSGSEVAENEGLALVSSNAFTTAWACIATADAAALLTSSPSSTWSPGVTCTPKTPAARTRQSEPAEIDGYHAPMQDQGRA